MSAPTRRVVKSFGIATKVALAIALLITVSLGTLTFLAVAASRRSLQEQVESANLTAATLAARAVARYVADAASIMREAPGRPKLGREIRGANWPETTQVLENFLTNFTQFDYVVVQDSQGIIRARVPHAETVGQDFSFRDFFREVMRTRRPYISGVYVSTAARRPVVSIAVPVLDDAGAVAGVIVGALSLATLAGFVSTVGHDDRGLVYVVDGKGVLIAASGGAGSAKPGTAIQDLPIVREVRAGKTGTMEFHEPGRGESFLGAYVPVPALGWGVVAAQPVSLAYAAGHRLGRWLLWIALGFTAGAVVLGWALARTLTGPLLRLAEAAKKLGAGDFTVRVARESRDEVGALATSFNTMAEHLERSYRGVEQKTTEIATLNALLEERVTERTRQLEDLERAQERLLQTEKVAAMGQLLAGVAHELNNPLSVILGHTALLQEAVGTGPLAGRAEKIAQAGTRCARIVKNFLALARQRPPERHPVDVNQLVREAVELLMYSLRVDDVAVVFELADDLPVIWGDPHQLHQVVVNLVTNAHHAMHETEPPRRLVITTRVDPARARVHLEVADTGPGIPRDIQARIFEPFFTTKAPGQGTGLGLSLCRGIVENHGGLLDIESEPGRGALFRIELPVTALGPAAATAPAAKVPASVRPKAILVIDDEPEVVGVLADLLAADGHQVETAGNGRIGLEKLQARSYDLILSDVRMPELDGPGLYREIERRMPDVLRRFVFMTGDDLSAHTRAFLDETAVRCLSKPFDLAEVRRVVAVDPEDPPVGVIAIVI